MKKLFGGLRDLLLLGLILLVIGGFCVLKYKLYKNKQEALKPYKEALTSQTTEEINAQKSTLWTRIKNFADEKINVRFRKNTIKIGNETQKETKSDDDTNTLIHFDVSSEYNSFIFDDTLFMFEGNQGGERVKTVLNRMITTASDDFYSNPTLTVKNIGGSDRTIVDDANYIANIESVRNSIEDKGTYNISFGYNKIKTHANEVIIEKK